MNVIENNTLAEVSGGYIEKPIPVLTLAPDPDPEPVPPIICPWPPIINPYRDPDTKPRIMN